MVRKLTTVLLAASLAVALGGCNTVKGLGKDVQSVGEAGSRAIH